MRSLVLSCTLILVLATGGACFGQGAPGCYPTTYPGFRQCAPAPPLAPITRRVQVEVPVPCPPEMCGPPAQYPSFRPCPPPQRCEPRPVRVHIDVRVRPEPCFPNPPLQQACPEPDPLRPVLGALGAIMAVPVNLLEAALPFPEHCARPVMRCGPPPVCRPAFCPPNPNPQCYPQMQGPSCMPGPPVIAYQSACPPQAVCGPPRTVCQKVRPGACPPRSDRARVTGRPVAYSDQLTGGIGR